MTEALDPINSTLYIVTRPNEKGTVYYAENVRHAVEQCCVDAGYEGVADAAVKSGLESVELFIRTVDVQPLEALVERITIADPEFGTDIGGNVPHLHVAFSIKVDGHVVHHTLEWLDEDYDVVSKDQHLSYGDTDWCKVVTDAAIFEGMDFDEVKDDVRRVVLAKLQLILAPLKALVAYDGTLQNLKAVANQNDPSRLGQVNRLVGWAFSSAIDMAEEFGSVTPWRDDVNRALTGTRFVYRHENGDDYVSVALVDGP